jgi:hypothetical protein
MKCQRMIAGCGRNLVRSSGPCGEAIRGETRRITPQSNFYHPRILSSQSPEKKEVPPFGKHNSLRRWRNHILHGVTVAAALSIISAGFGALLGMETFALVAGFAGGAGGILVLVLGKIMDRYAGSTAAEHPKQPKDPT